VTCELKPSQSRLSDGDDAAMAIALPGVGPAAYLDAAELVDAA
jgi:hypothetical protein